MTNEKYTMLLFVYIIQSADSQKYFQQTRRLFEKYLKHISFLKNV